VSFAVNSIFTFTDNTVIVDTSDTANINTLIKIAKRLNIPTGVNPIASKARLVVSWAAVDGAASYNLFYGTSTVLPETPAQTNITGTTTLITGLTNETTYYVWVQAVNTGGVSELSEMAAGTPTNAYTVNSTDTYTYAITGINADSEVSAYTINVTGSFTASAVTFASIGNKTITIKGNDTNRSISRAAFTIPSGITLELDSITLTASVVRIEAGGTLTIKPDSTITGANAHGVFVNGGTVNMTGGAISGNSTSSIETGDINSDRAQASYGGGVYINSGTFTMSGGTINNNMASYSSYYNFTYDCIINESYGGGVYINNGTLAMSGGTISGNSNYAPAGLSTTRSYAYGGGVYVNSGTFTMTGGTIDGNSANAYPYSAYNSYGGGVYVSSGGSFSKTGGTIAADNSADIGKAAYVYSGNKKRNTTAGPGINLNSATSANWE
jgi:hypothetical protein